LGRKYGGKRRLKWFGRGKKRLQRIIIVTIKKNLEINELDKNI
jgi:hypothetical protein